jgi:ribosome-associated heat shock protein Hsp15
LTAADSATERQRLDKWLWHARFARTRTLAAQLVTQGYVRVNGVRAEAPARSVKRGDVLTLALARTVAVIKVLDFVERRGPTEVAQRLYEPVPPVEGSGQPSG